MVNRIQNLRKDLGFDVTDKIRVEYQGSETLIQSVTKFISYICSEVLAVDLIHNSQCTANEVDVNEETVYLNLTKES